MVNGCYALTQVPGSVFIGVPVWKSGNIPFNAYRSPWTPLLKREVLDVIYVLMNLMLSLPPKFI
jgi:hypothetical protein